ncbi:MAG: bifunctional L-myo-inositol-1-phosphate cytidylyltransferase/CDP-L-myo-inositol myo-inositolphosphotransferase [Candidatus Asgardarchaeia archaeon]
MKCVVLAAGFGIRLRPYSKDTPKGLIKVAGREILYRSMKILQELGVEEFVVVTNRFHEEKMKRFLEEEGFKHTLVINDEPERGNGYSLYLSRDFIDGKFILIMCDHVYEKEFLKKAINGKGLIVDSVGKYIDQKEATKVICKEGRVSKIGKEVERYDYFDTGIFVLEPEVFNYADEVIKEKGSAELSEIVERAKLEVTEVSGYLWMDIDNVRNLRMARKLLIRNSLKGKKDGIISRNINRRISTAISELLVDRITPNQATIFTFLIGMVSGLFNLLDPVLGGLVYQLSSILDGVDGEIARASMRISKFGGWFDSILDRYVDFFFLSTLAVYARFELEFWPVIVLAVFGSTMVSYSAERYRAAYVGEELPEIRYLVGRRDERTFLSMILCIFGLIRELFIVLAIITNLKVIARVYLVWKYKYNKGGDRKNLKRE